METNVGGFDRIARLVAGLALFALGIAAGAGVLTLASGTLGTALAGLAAVVGLVFFLTGLTRTCLLYSLLGVNTCPAK